MVYIEYELLGRCLVDLDTEIKYDVACAKYDKVELIKFVFNHGVDEKDDKRLLCCVTKVLRTVKREGKLQFFVNEEGFENSITEAEFLINKYPQYIDTNSKEKMFFYVKT